MFSVSGKVHFSAGFREIGDMALSDFHMALKIVQEKNEAAQPLRMALQMSQCGCYTLGIFFIAALLLKYFSINFRPAVA